ncbi:MAG TPA: hypothetical protein VFK33_04705 [Bacillales bacterium]|nr:hypothetical protein [Bacillales bacterium]
MPNILKSLTAGFLCLFFLSACGYTGNPEVQDHVYKAQLNTVQQAVDQFQKDTGVLPIKTRDQKTPLYQKYPIAFENRLIPKYLPDAPENAYMNGGLFEYVLVNAEKDPTVKVIDLTTVQVVQKLQRRVNFFEHQHHYTPTQGTIGPKRYKLYYKSLGYDQPPYVKSPFTGYQLGFVVGPDSKVHIDYRKDLNAFMKKYRASYKPGQDIRNILVQHSPFVPVDSFPYTVNPSGDPVFLTK